MVCVMLFETPKKENKRNEMKKIHEDNKTDETRSRVTRQTKNPRHVIYVEVLVDKRIQAMAEEELQQHRRTMQCCGMARQATNNCNRHRQGSSILDMSDVVGLESTRAVKLPQEHKTLVLQCGYLELTCKGVDCCDVLQREWDTVTIDPCEDEAKVGVSHITELHNVHVKKAMQSLDAGENTAVAMENGLLRAKDKFDVTELG